jgi:ribonuclease HI
MAQDEQSEVEQNDPFVSSAQDGTSRTPQRGRDFSGMNLEGIMVIEIFAGTARLTRAVRDIGLSGLAVDKDNTRTQNVHIANYDLNDPPQFKALCELVQKHHAQILWVHFAPACGTASRARGRPLPKLKKLGVKVPQPLRSDAQPMGLDGLGGLDKVKTETANITYENMCLLARVCHGLGIAISIENPENSIFWKVPVVTALTSDIGGFMTYFDNCCHGGSRRKGTGWWANVDWFEQLAVRCDNSHFHEKWNADIVDGKVCFPTHLEAAYPVLLCRRLASIARDKAISFGACETSTLEEQNEQAPSTQHRILLDMLPRGRKFRPLVSEFGHYEKWAISATHGPTDAVLLQLFPKGAKIVHRQFYGGPFRVDEDVDVKVHESCTPESDSHEIVTVGVPREAMDFLARAVKAGHPRTVAVHLSETIKKVLRMNFGGDDYSLTKERSAFLWKWSNRAKELMEEEKRLHASLQPHLQQLLRGKRLLLLKEVLVSLNYPDSTLVDEISSGFTLHGWMQESNVFPKDLKRPEYSLEMVRNMAKGLNPMIFAQVNSTSDDELARATWENTMEELEKQWVWRDVTSDISDVILAKRFGLQQKNKIRVIDDCSLGGYNKTYGTKEKLRVHAVDQIAAYLSWICTELGEQLDDELVGRTYDLRSAYKQFGVSAETRDQLRLLVWDAEQRRPCMLGVNALPFGAAGSVSAFLRISMALWFIGTVGLKLCWTVFYDDYTVICKKRMSHGTGIAAEALFDLFGMWFAKEGTKAVEFSDQVKTLGLVIRLGRATGPFTVGHTAERRQELCEALEAILKTKCVEPKQAERLRGRMQWFEGYAFGRIAQHSLKTLGELAMRQQRVVTLTESEVSAIGFLLSRVQSAEAIRITTTLLDNFLIFTDGACEGDNSKSGSVGGVLVGPNGQILEHFSSEVPSCYMSALLKNSENPIYELELLPVYIALHLWSHKLISSHVVMYLDNDAARAALCKGYGATSAAQSIVQKVMEQECRCELKTWFARVPTHSNIADGPSHLQCKEIELMGSKKLEVDWNVVLEDF